MAEKASRQLFGETAIAASHVGSIAVGWRAILMMSEGQHPHPGRSHRCRVRLKDAADHDAIGQHVVIVIIPFA
jgi:hypothetical protein